MKRVENGLSSTEQKRIRSAVAAGKTLFGDGGYTYTALPNSTSRFAVLTPRHETHTVDLDARTCTCKAAKYGSFCRHLAALLRVEQQVILPVTQHPVMVQRVLLMMSGED